MKERGKWGGGRKALMCCTDFKLGIPHSLTMVPVEDTKHGRFAMKLHQFHDHMSVYTVKSLNLPMPPGISHGFSIFLVLSGAKC